MTTLQRRALAIALMLLSGQGLLLSARTPAANSVLVVYVLAVIALFVFGMEEGK